MQWNYLFSGQEELVDKVINFFTSKATDPALFEDIVKKCKNSPFATDNQIYVTRLNLGLLSINNFLYYEDDFAKKNGIKVVVLEAILNRLCKNTILFTEYLLQNGTDIAYTLNDNLAEYLYSRGLIKNVIFGFNYIATNYEHSVYKIIVVTDSGNTSIGTGFLINLSVGSNLHSIIITNEHVAKYNKELEVFNKEGQKESWNEIIICEDKTDVAAIVLDSKIKYPAFHLYPSAEILDDIIIMGYPPVPTARDSYQLVHKGEINSFITDYWNQEYVLFSAKTSPGNSGGPVINNMGIIVGMVTQQLIHKDENQDGSRLPYFAAVPTSSISKFIDQQVINKLK